MSTVSVIIPAFNTAAYIGRAIDSTLAQTFGDLEVLVVDDGSTDETPAIVASHAVKDSRVRVFSQSNSGVPKARNRAMHVATGEYFAILDSDDEWMPGYLEAQLGVLEARPDIAVLTSNVLNRGGHFDGQPYWPVRNGGPHLLTLLDIIENEDSICVMSVFRRKVYETIGGFDESLVRGSEDYDFWLRAAGAGFTLAQTFQPLAFYQRRPGSLSANELNMLGALCGVLTKAKRECDERPAERRAIDRQLARFRRHQLILQGKMALRKRDFPAAAQHFGALYKREGGPRLALLAALSRYAPAPLLWLDAVRQSLRDSR